jgi:hypothetical protein
MTVKESDSQLLIEGPPFPVQEVSNGGDDYRIAVFIGNKCLGWSGTSYSYRNMRGNENIGIMSLRVLTDKGEVKPGEHSFVVKVAASGPHKNIYHYNARYRRNWVRPDLTYTVKEIAYGGEAQIQMKNYKKRNWGTRIAQGSRSMGPSMNMGALPTVNQGMDVTTMEFTPKYGDSYLLIEGPPITVQETRNIADDFWIAVFRSDGTRLGACGHSFSHENWNPQPGLLALRVWVRSWGTKGDTLKVKAYTSGGNSNNYLYNTVDTGSFENPPLTFTITEVKNVE